MSLRSLLIAFAVVIAPLTAAATVALVEFLPAAARPAWLPAPLEPLVPAALAALAVGGPAAWLAARLGGGMQDTVRLAANVTASLAAGEIGPPVAPGGPTDLGRLVSACGDLQDSLGGLVDRMAALRQRLAEAERDAEAAVGRQSRAIAGFSGSAQDIAAAVAQISATAEQLLEATAGVTAAARRAAEVAAEGRGGLGSMTASMQQLDEAMNAFSRKLATISQRAAGITAVVTTIAKVAEQTNLLSVNATIEAEKAGESGRGFRIVAQEIRRLADQTALATKDIERMVRDMQAAVTGGTVEMDRFRGEVSGRIGEVAEVGEKLGRIIDPVQSLTRSLEQVHDGMRSQSEGARQIRSSMESLRGDAAESTASLDAVSRAVAAVRAAIAELGDEVVRFRR